MGGEHDRDPVRRAQLRQEAQELAARRGVEPAGRLVEEEKLRAHEERLRELGAPLEPARERAHPVAPALGQTEASRHRLDGGAEGRTGEPVEMPVVDEVLLHGERAVHARVLEDDAQAAADPVGLARHVVSEHARGTAAGGEQGGKDPKERALAPAVRTEEAEELAALDAQRDAVERDALAVAVAQLLDLERGPVQRCRRSRSRRCSAIAATQFIMSHRLWA